MATSMHDKITITEFYVVYCIGKQYCFYKWEWYGGNSAKKEAAYSNEAQKEKW